MPPGQMSTYIMVVQGAKMKPRIGQMMFWKAAFQRACYISH